jgi:hypothetical protein
MGIVNTTTLEVILMLKGRFIKGFLSGFIISTMLLGSATVFGAALKQKIEVVLENMQINVNGKATKITNLQGKTLQPINYNGYLYLPLTTDLEKVLNVKTRWDYGNKVLDIQKPFANNNIKVFAEEKEVILEGVKGDKIEPFMYNGSCYLPIDAAAKALGKTVQFDEKENKIHIGRRASIPTPSVWLKDLDYITKDYNWYEFPWDPDKNTDNMGRKYTNGFIISGSGACKEYRLYEKYSKLTVTCVIRNEDKDNDTVGTHLYIFGDETNIYSTNMLKANSEPVTFTVDVSKVNKLKLKIVGNGCLGIVNTGLYEK